MSKRTKIIVGVVGGLFILGAIGSLAKTSATATAAPAPTVTKTVTATPAAPAPAVTVTVTAAPAPAPTVTVTVTVTAAAPQPAPAPAPAGDTFKGDGTYLVGTDIKPGTYKTAGPGDAGMCYWERNSSADGGLGSIIANDNLNGQGVVTIKSSDKVFKSTGCQDWTKVG